MTAKKPIKPKVPSGFGFMKGKMIILGDIVSPDPEPWDSELGIAYRGENGEPVYYTGNGIETTDDLKTKRK
jgi:hypothetical protein